VTRLRYWLGDFIGNAWLWGYAVVGLVELTASRVAGALRRR
jgi:hypothetical protein